MTSTLPFYVDYLPPSYSAVMAEKESSIHWEINIQKSTLEAQRMLKIIQFQSDMTQDVFSHKLIQMNDLLENLIKEAEGALCTRMNNPRKKKRKHKPVNDAKMKCVQGQQALDTTLKEAKQIAEKTGGSAKEHRPSLPFMMHSYAISAVKRTKRLFAITRQLNRSTQLQMMLLATCLEAMASCGSQGTGSSLDQQGVQLPLFNLL
ncbi:hypothetical protein G6F46_003041 [Rhizopus delemar]|uniref:Uncharacterized protein n=2 Tax=Rhizopus TaxID=4842 RepID=A0A9P6YZK4_9FUNG|nr:hypothetical protein G6F43_003279 [Rhizopus delemar]KAG1549263.1 hypothetical protein G6F51_003168 [Rhizopus arrhizus]KAG1456650.1 hypothetical protein G6F55_006392 [Rhizopus delemar]KAG1504385.1 hypothetical protein G6F54_001050 [Rhizopus delemar]KAG1515849.1 hypothetical protein G6F53_002612 [Rhizopus delemar]